MTDSSLGLAADALRAARAALQRGDAAAAAALCREALERGRDDAPTWALLGTALRTLEPAAAEAALRRALERDARSVDANFHLGNLYREQRRYGESGSAYERALALVSGHASIPNNLGLALEGAGESDRAWRPGPRPAGCRCRDAP
jgi:Tfp pilus assembly protein PilF